MGAITAITKDGQETLMGEATEERGRKRMNGQGREERRRLKG